MTPPRRPDARWASATDPVLLFVGRVQPLKGLDVAVALWPARAPRRRPCVVVGGPSGPEGEAELAAGPATWPTTSAWPTGSASCPPQPHHLLSTYYRAADVCLVPSRSESFGLVALEAAACGTPVVAAAVGGLRTIVDHGRTGFLVEGGDPADFAAPTSPSCSPAPASPRLWGEQAADRARRVHVVDHRGPPAPPLRRPRRPGPGRRC